MNPVAVGLDGLLAMLLLAALALGGRLNGRLKGLRDSQAGFAAAVIELNQAAARAEAGLAALKTASESAHDDLLARIETARALATKLERATHEAERAAARSERLAPDRLVPERRVLERPGPESAYERPAAPRPPAGGALAAIAALAEGRTPDRAEREPPVEPRTTARPPPRRSARSAFDEELFEGKAPRRDDAPALGPLRPAAPDPAKGARARDERARDDWARDERTGDDRTRDDRTRDELFRDDR